ncbi:MAG: hypothetical protein CL814_08710 [Confluentimicrobium sp.]|jgi:transcriptional regulator of nitric oxide reductase|uniref:Transcriptional regulator of nitric oxide reductase n=1 Tax=Actibacterium naphthalenivorans TaxID=1614693 RepID=A0A840CBU8_9RHOB|nr:MULTISPECIES: DUF4286 family protein [Actibacterium]KGB83684.1 hypothetical protein JT55_00665 [Rhodovulum sp. NI22]MDY6860720.1 DUF4286 family protein [Pseudomonadota bacterium]ALG88929.1 hypothetical protein TQ29_00560 [Actibacterium sp. EMB200-NS6]MBB4021542.1 transcriptional regulator of nitric oxide reductase [Actibacterium naphthalenivorans]MBC57003.1 hypothetical protein [Actibacterium sp.]|tara:strand:+ start:3744 stop:4094 length:351 start_codon:yes stop_codon:yes gene_type:complete
MSQFAYVVLSNPVPGREDEYNDWYSNRHLADVTAVPGFIAAQRFRLMDDSAEGAPAQRYMAIYTMETDDPAAAVESLRTLVETGKMAMSEAFSMEDMAIHLYETITPLVCKAPEGA